MLSLINIMGVRKILTRNIIVFVGIAVVVLLIVLSSLGYFSKKVSNSTSTVNSNIVPQQIEEIKNIDCVLSEWSSCGPDNKSRRTIITNQSGNGNKCGPLVGDCCPNTFINGKIGKPGEVITRDCGLGASYTGNSVSTCDITGSGMWSEKNNCTSNGLTDLRDITGKWVYTYMGNNFGIVDISFNTNTKMGNITGGNIPDEDLRKIQYIPNKGYSIGINQPMAFTDSTYSKLDGGNYDLTKV